MRRRARLSALICVGAAAALIANSCTNRPANSAAGSYVQQVTQQGTAHWTCTSHGLGGHMQGQNGAESGYANPAYQGRQKGTLSRADCLTNAATFDRVLKFAMQYPTKQSAARFAEAVQFVVGLGTHHLTGSLGGPSVNPFFLQYDGDLPNSPLAGMSWFTYSGAQPPAGFAGNNDFWHSHTSLCYTTRDKLPDQHEGAPGIGVAANEISDAECSKIGGVNLKLPGIWMSHAWIVPGYENKFDVFAGASDCVKGTGKPAANDPCHTTEAIDPEHAGHGGGDHDMGNMTTTTRRAATTPTTRAATTPTTRRAAATTTMAPMPGMDHGDHGH